MAAVLLFHAGHLRGGYLGVDLFFTLSGFLITSLLLSEIRTTGRVRLAAFWGRRARRLLPALALLFIGVAVYARFAARPNDLDQIRWDGVWTAFYAANWRAVLAKANYWSLFASPSPFQHAWSLAIEEQFYLVWPIVMVAVARKARDAARATAYIAGGVAIAGSLWLMTSYDRQHASRSYFGTDTRVASIAFGAALAALLAALPRARALPRPGRIAVQTIGWAGAACIGLLWCRLDGASDNLYRGGLTLAAVAATCLLAAVVTNRDGMLARMLSIRALRALGLISYGVYLYHWPIYVYLSPARTHQVGWTLTAIRVAFTLGAATASYYLVERPIRRGTITRRSARVFGPAVAAIATLSLVMTTAGAHPIVDEAAGRVDDVVTVVHTAQRAPEGTHRLMLAGSSIAALLAGPIRHTRAARRLIVLNRAVIGCGFPDGVTRTRKPGEDPKPWPGFPCGETWVHDLYAFRPEAVLYIPGNEPGDETYEFRNSGRWTRPCTPGYDDEYRAALRRHVARLVGRAGTTVYVATFAYTAFPFFPKEGYRATDCVNRIIRALTHTTRGVGLVDLAHHMCPHADAPCAFEDHGMPIRPDGEHYSGRAAVPVAAWILGQMRLDR